MKQAIIIDTKGQRIAVLEGAGFKGAERAAREYAKANGLRIITDIISQGAYRAWVQ